MLSGKYSNSIFIFTDGSKHQNNDSGFAIFVPNFNHFVLRRTSKLLSIFYIELIAISCAVDHIDGRDLGFVVIASNSQTSLAALSAPDRTGHCHHLVYRIKEKILKLQQDEYRIVIVWIPEHTGVWGNDAADFLANLAAKWTSAKAIPCSETQLFFPHNMTSILEEFLLASFSEFKEESQTKHIGYRYFNKVKKKFGSPWFKSFPSLSRKAIAVINRLHSGHMRLNSHLHCKGMIDDPRCSCQQDLQTIEHVLFHCSKHKQHSDAFVLSLTINEFSTDNIDWVFSDPDRIISALLQFLQDSSTVL